MPWDKDKCKKGVPLNFSDTVATQLVMKADFSKAVYVNISSKTRNTKQAYTFCEWGGYEICIVGHSHAQKSSKIFNVPGNCFIPGWSGWAMRTPDHQARAIARLKTGGVFPGSKRYPHIIAELEDLPDVVGSVLAASGAFD